MFNPQEHMMNLKGKDYLQVLWRLVWFREEKPNWCIETKAETVTNELAVFSAKILDENGIQKSSGYGSETPKDFKDYIEKAETKAIGRALAMLGYGTQFAPELDEGERIVDAPIKVSNKSIFITAEQAKELTQLCIQEFGAAKAKEYFQKLTGYKTTLEVPTEQFEKVKKDITAEVVEI